MSALQRFKEKMAVQAQVEKAKKVGVALGKRRAHQESLAEQGMALGVGAGTGAGLAVLDRVAPTVEYKGYSIRPSTLGSLAVMMAGSASGQKDARNAAVAASGVFGFTAVDMFWAA